jgi:hypothetical protein
MRRYDPQGTDVTDNPSLWTPDDCEITRTQYNHPDITEGQHTNGPADVWIRQAAFPLNFVPAGLWIDTYTSKGHLVRGAFVKWGMEFFLRG